MTNYEWRVSFSTMIPPGKEHRVERIYQSNEEADARSQIEGLRTMERHPVNEIGFDPDKHVWNVSLDRRLIATWETVERPAPTRQPPQPVDRSARTLTDGSPVTEDHREIDPSTGLQKGYVVLSEEERAKGFVRWALATIDSQASALAEAKAEIGRLRAMYQECRRLAESSDRATAERIAKLEAALAKAPHLFFHKKYGYFAHETEMPQHTAEECARLGGRCAALASPSEPAGGKGNP